MITKLYEYEEKARQEYAEGKSIDSETLQEMGLCFRFFENDTTINTIRNLEEYLQSIPIHNNRKTCIEFMNEAISNDTDFELQIYFA